MVRKAIRRSAARTRRRSKRLESMVELAARMEEIGATVALRSTLPLMLEVTAGALLGPRLLWVGRLRLASSQDSRVRRCALPHG